MTGLYIHVPFCVRKCNYCAFHSVIGTGLSDKYLEILKSEICGSADIGLNVDTMYLGGGTPSMLTGVQVGEIIDWCRQSFVVEGGAEITMEVNPDTLDSEKLREYKYRGVTRLSIGLQAYQDRLLKFLGRTYRVEVFEKAFGQAREAGFANINVDLIFGIPTQTVDDWRETVERVIKLNPEHVSAYSLSIEDGTMFGQRLGRGELVELDEETNREMYWLTVHKLRGAGFGQYEISNFAQPGYACKHNLNFWKGGSYLGFGAGAHSYYRGCRWENPHLFEYIKGKGAVNKEKMTPDQEVAARIMLGLRISEGLDISMLANKTEVIKELISSGLVEVREGHARLTDRGMDRENYVVEKIVIGVVNK